MSKTQSTLLRFSRFTTSLSEVPLLSRRAQLRGFTQTIDQQSQTRSSTDNPTTGSTAAQDSVPEHADNGPGARDAGEEGSGSYMGMSGSVSDSTSAARNPEQNDNASSTPAGQQMRDGPNENVNEAHNSPSEAKRDSAQVKESGQQDADPILKGKDEGAQSINAEKEAAKK